MIREDFLQQNSFVDVDAYSEYDRQAKMLALIRDYDTRCRAAAGRRIPESPPPGSERATAGSMVSCPCRIAMPPIRTEEFQFRFYIFVSRNNQFR